jgi:tetratricopeptide (TPR) repeat protein
MNKTVRYLGFLICFGASIAFPQTPAPHEMTVVVVNAHVDPTQPVQGVRVSLSFVAGSEKVVDARDATNRSGQALLLVSPEAAQRDDLRVEITGMNDLVVFQPADGQLSGLPASVTVRLLPKGSILLLGPPQIEAMLQRLSIQNRAKNQEIHALKAELAAAQSQKPDDLTAAMTEWAKANGFEVAEVDNKVQQWAEDIQRRKDQATANEKALAELALKHYGIAAQLFDQAADDIGQSMDEEEKRFLEERRKQLRELVDKKFQSANTYQLNLQFHQATQILTQARDRAAAERNRYREDAALRSIWLDAVLRLANARRDEGEVGEAGDSSALLAQSIKDYQGLLQERTAPADSQDWATAQTNLGIALWEQGVRGIGAQATALLSQSVQAFRAALGVVTKADQPEDWARTQNNLGNALKGQGERSSGARATSLFAESVRAYRAALEVRTRIGLPQDWAGTQNNLGVALMAQGERSSGTQAADLLGQAVEALRAALEVQKRTDDPQAWARTENNLGIALRDRGMHGSGAQAVESLSQAIQAYRAALEVRTKALLPQDWAATQNNLGVALMAQGERTSSAQAVDLLGQAVAAFRAALEVYTKSDLPQDWAATQNNLAAALSVQGARSGDAPAADLLAQSAQAYRAALDVYTKTDLPQDWAATQNNLGAVLVALAERSSGAPATDLFTQAVRAHRAALEVYTKPDTPQDWAMTENNLALALRHLAEQSRGAETKALLTQAAQACRAALEVFTRADLPRDWAAAQNNLGNTLVDLGDFLNAANALDAALEAFPDNTTFLQTAVSIDHDNLFRYDRSYELTLRWLKLDDSMSARLSMEEEDLTTSRFRDCESESAKLDDASIPAPAILIRDAIKLSCQWGNRENQTAQQTAETLRAKSSQLQDMGWEFAGTRHFFASSPAFDAGRASWIALFDSLEKGDGAAMAAALHQLEDVMKH